MSTPLVTNTNKQTQGLDPEFHASSNRALWLIRSIISTPSGLVGAIMVAIVVLIGVFAPLIAPYGFAQTNFEVPFQVPGTVGYVFGTEDLGLSLIHI